jgi:hypothetical protein
MNIRVTRLANGPIIGPHLHPSIGVNIQGPSLIRVPDWIEHRLGAYYLYFANHKGIPRLCENSEKPLANRR